MNKKQFIDQLSSLLKDIPYDERKDILRDYEDHFEFGKNEEMKEEDIAASLGTPRQISKEILTNYHLNKAEESLTPGNIMRVLWATLGLGFFNLIVVLGPVLAIAIVVLAAWLTGAVFIVSPLLVLVSSLIDSATFEWFDLFLSITLSGVGMLLLSGMYFATRVLAKSFVTYLRFNVKIAKGGISNE